MGRGYALAYALGAKPWERAGAGGAAQLGHLIAVDEAARGGPGRALDLGCGTGAHAVALAERGWQVTGVDQITKALAQARARAAGRGVNVTFVQGDVTRLTPADVGTDYDLVLDIGCFHGLTDAQQIAMGRSIGSVTASDATLLMLAFRPGSAPRPLPRGADTDSIEAALPGWQVVSSEPATTKGMPAPLRRTAPTFYRLTRVAAGDRRATGA